MFVEKLSNNPLLEIKIPTLAGLAVLKTVAWKEKYPERKKDAEDLLFIMNKYEYAGNFDRLYGTEFNLLESENYDTKIACIKLLGKDMVELCDHLTLEKIKQITENEINDKSYSKLVVQMMDLNDDYDDILNRLINLKETIIEA